MNEDWNVTPENPVTAGAAVTATYTGTKHVKSVKFVKIPRTLEVTANALTYTGSAQALVSAVAPATGTLQFKVGDGEYSDVIPTATEAGTYTVSYKVDGSEAYEEGSVDVTIAKAEATAKTNKTTWAVGDIICANGSAYTIDNNYTIPNNVTATAIVAYKGSATADADYKNGLALALTDAYKSDAGGYTPKWRDYKDGETKEGIDNPSQVSSTDNIASKPESGREFNNLTCTGTTLKRNSHTAAAREDWPAFYQAGYAYEYECSVSRPSQVSEWFLPSIYQWNQIVKGLLKVSSDLTINPNSNMAYVKINASLQKAIDDNNVNAKGLANAAYWTSSELDKENARCYRANGVGGYGKKTETNRVRPVIAF